MKHKPTPARDYPPGFFKELIRAHAWPPMFESRLGHNAADLKRYQAALVGRTAALVSGGGWGTGYIALPASPNNLAPGWMGAKP